MVDVKGSLPKLDPAPAALVIRQGYHPLLLEESSKPVAFDLEMAADRRTLLVSGPNAGGKTVLLKAVALINTLAQSGIVPPVGPDSSLPIFRRVFADIGDHQSIAESLSTFSAHVFTVNRILQEADDGSLVLLDEVGAGTDPFEGAALAGAVLLALTARGALTIATTHLSQLKDLAAAREGFLNASLQFDGETLAPTYRFLLGQPGRSYGIAIAKRLGFPADVLGTAEELVPEGARSLEAALAELENAEAEVRRREEALSTAEAQIASTQAAIRRESVDLAGREEQMRRFLLEARRRVEEALGIARAAVDEATAKEARRLVEEGVREEGEALKKLEGKGWRLKSTGTNRAEPTLEACRGDV
jgi:DNA mismatch repair protein MutS2